MSDDSILSYFFNRPTAAGQLSYDELQNRRRLALALATRNRKLPTSIGEGLTYLGESIASGLEDRDLMQREAAQKAYEKSRETAPPDPDYPGPQQPARPAVGAAGKLSALDLDPVAPLTAPPAAAPAAAAAQAAALPQPGPPQRPPALPLTGPNQLASAQPLPQQGAQAGPPPGQPQIPVTPEPVLPGAEPVRDQISASLATQPKPSVPAMAGAEAGASYAAGTGVPEAPRRVQLASRDTGTVSDAPPIGAGMPPPDGRDELVDSMVPPPTRLAGPAPQPQPAPAQPEIGKAPPPAQPAQQLQVPPQAIPPKQPDEQPTAPGPRPTLQSVTTPYQQQYLKWSRENSLDPNLPPEKRAGYKAMHDEMMKNVQDQLNKEFTIWHERTTRQETERLGKEKKDLDIIKQRGEIEDAAEKRVLAQRFGRPDVETALSDFTKKRDTANLAAQALNDNRIMMSAYKNGVISGFGADMRLNVAKLSAWALQNGYDSNEAANTEIMRAVNGANIRTALAQINTGPSAIAELRLAQSMSPGSPGLEPKAFMALLQKSTEFNNRLLNDYEDQKDYYLGGTRAERSFDVQTQPTAPKQMIVRLLENRDDPAARATFNDLYGPGSAELEIERVKRRARRRQE